MTQASPTAEKPKDFARWRRRDHANIEALQNLVIAEIARRAHAKYAVENPDAEAPPAFEMPTNVRALISALQGAHGGGQVPFEEFERDYLTIGAQLQFRGTPEAIRSRVRSWVQKLDDWQFLVGYQLFVIVPGGDFVLGEDNKPLTYADGSPIRTKTKVIDYLKPRVDEGVMLVRNTPEWKHPGKALASQVEKVIADLPTLGTRAESGKVKAHTPQSVEVYEQRQEERIIATIEKVAHEIELKGGDAPLWVRTLARAVHKMSASLEKTADARHDLIAVDRVLRAEDEGRGETGDVSATNAYMCKSDADEPPTEFVPPDLLEEDDLGTEKLTQATQEVISDEGVSISDLAESDEPDMLEWALTYARQGIAVFPCHTVYDGMCTCACNKDCTEDKHACGSECGSKGKHPDGSLVSNGVKGATTDESKIRRWWAKKPYANIGIAMGGPLRLAALDVDPRNGGSASLADLVEHYGDAWFDTFTQESGGGGNHFLYRLSEGVEVVKGNQKNKLAPGIDTKTEGGYLIGAPSMHESGRRYSVANNTYISNSPPQFLVDFLAAREPRVVIDFQEARERRTPGAAVSGEKFYEGERNDGLFAVGIGRWRHGWAADATALHMQLLDVNTARCMPPIQDSEVAKIAAHIAADYGHLRGVDAESEGAA